MSFKPLPVLAALVLAPALGSAGAATVTASFDFTLSGNANVPTMTLLNSSTGDFRITGFSLTVGHAQRGWDFVQNLTGPAGGSATLNSPDALDGNARSDVIDIDFGGFDPTLQASWTADLDGVNSNTTYNYRNSLFNNGTQPNAVLTVDFEAFGATLAGVSPFSLGFALPDNASSTLTSYSFSDLREFSIGNGSNDVPEPGVLSLVLAGLLGLHWSTQRRRMPAPARRAMA